MPGDAYVVDWVAIEDFQREEAEIEQTISGNVFRYAGYVKRVEAIKAAGKV